MTTVLSSTALLVCEAMLAASARRPIRRLLLIRDERVHLGPDRIHRALALASTDTIASGVEADTRTQGDGFSKLPELVRTLRLQAPDPRRDVRICGRQASQLDIMPMDGVERRAVGLEVRRVSSQDIAALACLRILDLRDVVGQQGLDVFASLHRGLSRVEFGQTHDQHDTAANHECDEGDEEDDETPVHGEPRRHCSYRVLPGHWWHFERDYGLWYEPCFSTNASDWFRDAIHCV